MRRTIFIALLLFSAHGAAEGQDFLQLNEGQRYWYLEGAYRAVAHMVALSGDPKRAECAADWWLLDRKAKQKLVEKTIAANPDRSETTIILGLLTQACGRLVPEKKLTPY